MALEPTDTQLTALLIRIAPRDADASHALRELYDLTAKRLYGVALRVLVDGVGGGVLEWFVEDNPEDWAEFDPADVAGTSTPT